MSKVATPFLPGALGSVGAPSTKYERPPTENRRAAFVHPHGNGEDVHSLSSRAGALGLNRHARRVRGARVRVRLAVAPQTARTGDCRPWASSRRCPRRREAADVGRLVVAKRPAAHVTAADAVAAPTRRAAPRTRRRARPHAGARRRQGCRTSAVAAADRLVLSVHICGRAAHLPPRSSAPHWLPPRTSRRDPARTRLGRASRSRRRRAEIESARV